MRWRNTLWKLALPKAQKRDQSSNSNKLISSHFWALRLQQSGLEHQSPDCLRSWWVQQGKPVRTSWGCEQSCLHAMEHGQKHCGCCRNQLYNKKEAVHKKLRNMILLTMVHQRTLFGRKSTSRCIRISPWMPWHLLLCAKKQGCVVRSDFKRRLRNRPGWRRETLDLNLNRSVTAGLHWDPVIQATRKNPTPGIKENCNLSSQSEREKVSIAE